MNEMALTRSTARERKPDPTGRPPAQDGSRETDARYRFLADSVPAQIWPAAPTGKLEYVNEVVLDYTGLPFQRIVEEGWEAVLHPEDVDSASQRWAHSVAAG